MTWIIASIAVVSFVFYHFHSKSKKKSQSTTICYHTRLDCENCISWSKCRQQFGSGLVCTKGES